MKNRARLLATETLLKEVPAVAGTRCYQPTGWVRLTLVDEAGAVIVVDCQRKHMTRLPPLPSGTPCS